MDLRLWVYLCKSSALLIRGLVQQVGQGFEHLQGIHTYMSHGHVFGDMHKTFLTAGFRNGRMTPKRLWMRTCPYLF